MTWYAKEILLKATTQALDHVRTRPDLLEFAYHVTGPLTLDWPAPELAHSLPDEGLIIIQPICSPDVPHGYDWFDGHAFDPTQDEGDALKPAFSLEGIGKTFGMDSADFLPFMPSLRLAKTLSQQTGTTTVFYDAYSWAGDMEFEMAWIFGQSEQVFGLKRGQSFGSGTVWSVDRQGAKTTDVPVLIAALRALDCPQEHVYFAPHDRGFDWARYRLSGSG